MLWFTTHARLRAENARLREALDVASATLQMERAMREALDQDNDRLRSEVGRMTNAALARSLRAPKVVARDERGRFLRVG